MAGVCAAAVPAIGAAMPAAAPAASPHAAAEAGHSYLHRAGARGDLAAAAGRSPGQRASQQHTAAPARSPAAATPSASTGASGSASAATDGQAKPFVFYDSTTPQDIPAGYEVATYADGPNPTPASEVAGRTQVLWIDINGSDPQASVLDLEPGCATPSVAPGWVSARLAADPDGVAILYTMISEWPAVQQAVASLPQSMQSHIRWWIADPTGYPHIVPGSDATQWYWGPNYDISTALPGF